MLETILDYFNNLFTSAITGVLFWIIITEVPSDNLIVASIAFGGIIFNVLTAINEEPFKT